MLFIFALPVMQVILFCLAIGRDPTGLKLAIVNNEMIGGVSLRIQINVQRLIVMSIVSHLTRSANTRRVASLETSRVATWTT